MKKFNLKKNFEVTGKLKPVKEPVSKPKAIPMSKVHIVYESPCDGMIEVDSRSHMMRMNTPVAQARILVDGNRYAKGMAVHSDNVPKGYLISVHTNKKKGTPKDKVLKATTGDEFNPFGITEHRGMNQAGTITYLTKAGDWAKRRDGKTTSSQILSRQPIETIKNQMFDTFGEYISKAEYAQTLKQGEVRKKYLESLVGDMETSAKKMSTTAFEGQMALGILNSNVIPNNKLLQNEVHIPDYPDGAELALFRHPFADKGESVRVINRKSEPHSNIVKGAKDVMFVSEYVAGIMSGADFDGDVVIAVPMNEKLHLDFGHQLDSFDPNIYESEEIKKKLENPYEKIRAEEIKQKKMGIVTNLNTNMELSGGYTDIEKVNVRNMTMVVIDSVKHNLDINQAWKDYGINDLIKKYGTKSVLTQSKRELVEYHKDGSVWYKNSYSTVKDFNNEKEMLYADYANTLLGMASRLRTEIDGIPQSTVNREAKGKYKRQIAEINEKVERWKSTKEERETVTKWANDMAQEDLEKYVSNYYKNTGIELSQTAMKHMKQLYQNQYESMLKEAYGIKDAHFTLTDRQWQAVMAGALNGNAVRKLLNYIGKDFWSHVR